MRLAEMGVQPTVVLLGQFGGRAHHLAGDVERRAGRERDGRERAWPRIVIAGDDPFAIGEHDIVVLHQPLVGDAARFHALVDDAARQRDAHAERLGLLDLDIDRVRHIGRKDEENDRRPSYSRTSGVR